MAVNTTVARNNFNRGQFGWVNLKVSSMTGIAVGGVLTIAGDLAVTAVQFLPNNMVQCRITGSPRGKGHTMPMGKGRLIIRQGDTVTG
jgi:hypothetical protein